MKEYKCPNAVREGEQIKCRKVNNLCGNVYYCRMGGSSRTEVSQMKEPTCRKFILMKKNPLMHKAVF